MVYDLTLSYNHKKDICHSERAHAIAMGFWRKERIIIIKKIIIPTETIALPTHEVGTANDNSNLKRSIQKIRFHKIYFKN